MSLTAAGAVRVRRPLLHGADSARALDVAEWVYARAFAHLQDEAAAPESIGRYGGAVFVAEALARAGRAGETQVNEALRRALVFAPDRLSLFDGAGGLLVALEATDPARTALTAVRAKLRAALAASLRDAPPGRPAQAESYDLIAGFAGRAVALARASGEPVAALAPFAGAFADAAERALESHDPDVAAINLGVSHGVAGVLAALGLALPDDRALARRYVELLLRCSHVVGGAHRWGAEWRAGEQPSARRSWCYRTAGVAAILGERARIDGDGALHALAADALAGVLDDPEPYDGTGDMTLCHGRSGVAALAWTFPHDDRLAGHAARLAHDVLDAFDDRTPLGYTSADGRFERAPGRAGFLDAALGVAQFLVDAATAQERRWLPLFGLTPD